MSNVKTQNSNPLRFEINLMKTIIFDFDGTIADTLPFTWKKVLQYLRKEKLVADSDEKLIEEIRLKSYHELMKKFKISWLKFPLIYLEIRKAQKDLYQIIETIQLFPGMRDLLKKLKNNNCQVGILSSNIKMTIDKFIKINDLNYFDFVHCEKNLFGKDRALNNLIKKYKLNKEDVIYVADEVRDIEACQKANVKIISVTWGFNKDQVLRAYKPTWLVKNPKEILSILT